MKRLLAVLSTSMLLWGNLAFADCALNGKVTYLYVGGNPTSTGVLVAINGTYCFGSVTSGASTSSAVSVLAEALTSGKNVYYQIVPANNLIYASLQ
jgi:hypothetical protein